MYNMPLNVFLNHRLSHLLRFFHLAFIFFFFFLRPNSSYDHRRYSPWRTEVAKS